MPQRSQRSPFLLLHLLSTIQEGYPYHHPYCHCHIALFDNPAHHPGLGSQIQTFAAAPSVLSSLQNEGRLRGRESNFTKESHRARTCLEGERDRGKEDREKRGQSDSTSERHYSLWSTVKHTFYQYIITISPLNHCHFELYY